jgi:hypothetical protein
MCIGELPSLYSTHMPACSRSGLPRASETSAGVMPREIAPTDLPGTIKTSVEGGGAASACVPNEKPKETQKNIPTDKDSVAIRINFPTILFIALTQP